jgi:hypothetical protein
VKNALDEMIEAERADMRGDPESEALAWLDKIAALDGKRSRYQDMAAEGHITFDELGVKLRELEGQRTRAEEELDNLQLRRVRLEDLERDRETLLREYAGMVPERLDELTGEERHQVYRMLRLQVFVYHNGDLEVRGVLREAVCTPMDTPLRIQPLGPGRYGACATMRSWNTETPSSGPRKAKHGLKLPAGSPKKRGRDFAMTPQRKPSPASPSNCACNRLKKPTLTRTWTYCS